MEATRIGTDELSRLQGVQARVRTLARNHGWFGDALRAAFVGYLGLGERFQSEKSSMDDRERQLARALLAKGWLFDPKARDNSPCLFVRVEGLCPVALADRLGKHGRGDAMPRKLEREGAAAALAALDRDVIYQARDLPEKKREAMAAEYCGAQAAKTHVSFSWMIVVSRPADWREPADPHSLDRADLERFGEADYRTIALHRLGGLADVGALRPIVPQPKDTGDMVRDVGAYAAWRFRSPIDDDHRDQNQPPLSVQALPADVAEQLLDDVETWAKGEATTRGESLTASGPSVSPDLLERLQRAAAAVNANAIDRAAERAAEKVARVFGGGDNGDLTPPVLPAGATDHGTPTDPTMRDLASEAGISDDTFRRVRNAALIEVKLKGAAARNRRYNPSEVDRLIATALAGNFLERTSMAEKWSRWGSKKAASKPHASK